MLSNLTTDVSWHRNDFPITKEFIYLDNAGLSALPTPVVQAVNRYAVDHSSHGALPYYEWLEEILHLREPIAKLLHATPEEIALTENTSEGLNVVASMLDWKPGDNVVLNDLEFVANVYPWLRLKKKGVEARIVKSHQGRVEASDIAQLIDARTRVVAVGHVEWTNGFKHDLEEVGSIVNHSGAYLVVDAAQSVGALQVDVRKMGIDFLSACGHKWLLSPLGTGIFYAKAQLLTKYEPPFLSWMSDEFPVKYEYRDCRPQNTAMRFMHGNINFAGFFGMKAALGLLDEIGFEKVEQRLMGHANRIVDSLQDKGFDFLSPLERNHRSHIITVSVKDPDKVVSFMRERKVIICKRVGGIRVSPSFYNTEEELDTFMSLMSRFS